MKILPATVHYNREKFLNDFVVSAAVCHFAMIIGESAAMVSADFKEIHTGFDWLLMRGMRNIIVHEYFGGDEHTLWDTVVYDIPRLVTDCENALKDFE